MATSNWKTLIFVLVLALGGVFEILKHVSPGDLSPWRHDYLHLSHATSEYHTRPELTNDHSNLSQAPLVAGMRTIPANTKLALNKGAKGTHTFSNPKDKDKKKDKKKKDDKKKKKDDKKKSVADDGSIQKRQQEKPKDQSDVDTTVASALTNGFIQGVPEKPSDGFTTLDEWKQKLLTTPDANETKLFIQQYNENLVTADVFYQIVELMVQDPRPEMQKLGVMAAGVTPSVLSFQVIAGVLKSEPSDAGVKQEAQSFLNNYVQLSYVNILGKVMSGSGDSYATYLAAWELQLAAQKALTQNSKTPPTRNPSAQQTSPNQSVAAVFQGFIGILQGLLNSPNASINNQAHQTLSTLQSLLGTHTTSPSTPS